MKRVPSSSAGAARRSYHSAYAKGATQATSKLLGGNKLSTPQTPAPRQPAPTKAKQERPAASEFNISFGRTGYYEEI